MASLSYRPEIDGLRAVAVLAVVVFHLNPNWLPGGFVGVDVFFVISGFLIASILLADCRSGEFSFARFYQRRIARLFPAFFCVALATIAAAAWIQSPQDLASCGKNLAAATLSLANVSYMTQGNYFEISSDAQPFLHYWSLSVEEQLYLLLPVVFAVLYRKNERWLLSLVIVACFVSFVTCLVVTRFNPSWAFYLLPTRAWELLIGCVVAVLWSNRAMPGHSVRHELIAAGGLAAIVASIVFLKESTTFPGYLALLPALGTLAVITTAQGALRFVQPVLSAAPLVFVGRISYALYLCHWPIFSLVDYRLYLASAWARFTTKIAITVLATLCCHYVVEKPGRFYFNQPERRNWAFAGLTAMIFICVGAGFHLRSTHYLNADPSSIAAGGIVAGCIESDKTLVLMGDSHASMYGLVCDRMASELGYKLNIMSVAAGDPLPDSSNLSDSLWSNCLAGIEQIQPEIIFLAIRWEKKLAHNRKRIISALEQLGPHTRQIVLITQPPFMPPEANRQGIRDGARPPFWEEPSKRAARLEINEFVKSLACDKVTIVDIEMLFSTNQGEVQFFDREGKILYHDSHHLTAHGAGRVKQMLSSAVKQSEPASVLVAGRREVH